MEDRFKLPSIVWLLFMAMTLLSLAYLLTLPAVFQYAFGPGGTTTPAVDAAHQTIASGIATLWRFLAPLLQLIIVLIILQWFLDRVGIDFTIKNAAFDFNVQALLAFIIVGTFCLSTLIGYSIEGLKELSLVVVGFYFGTRARPRDTAPTPVATQ